MQKGSKRYNKSNEDNIKRYSHPVINSISKLKDQTGILKVNKP